MEAPLFAAHLSLGTWKANKYEVDYCPICRSKNTLRFSADGHWWCSGCKADNLTITEFKERLSATDDIGRQLAEQIKFEKPSDGLIVVSEYKKKHSNMRIGTGFKKLDGLLSGLGDSGLTVLTGKRGQGKSTFAGQLALNAIQGGHTVCFYSGELSVSMFQNWIFSQASGEKHLIMMQDQFGNDHWVVDEYIEQRVRTWLGKNLLLYDNSIAKHSERNAILERFKMARRVYGCDLFFVDNLMTAKYAIDVERDFWRAQSNFAGELKDFAQENACHVILVAHPKKGDVGDINDSVSGSGDITNRADNVIQVKKVSEEEYGQIGSDAVITVSKNRDYGREGKIKYNFNSPSRRFIELDTHNIEEYGWIDLC
ncbi:MAG: hypothetical protein EOL98_13270 [Negativicutes bacterium]|nr:hypothetical protein [Negativicutes bacterium]